MSEGKKSIGSFFKGKAGHVYNKDGTVKCTAPIVHEGKILKRRFLGKTENFVDEKERRYHQKMLKYYAKGAQVFPYGVALGINGRQINYDVVLQEYYYE